MNISSKNSSVPAVDVNDVSHISAGTIVNGEVSSLTDIRIDGKVEGKIFSKGKVVVGESASVSGTLACSNVDFWGKMDGDIFVKDVFSLKSTAVLNGNVHVRKLQVEMGAQLNGTCAMITEEDYDRFVKDVISLEVPVAE